MKNKEEIKEHDTVIVGNKFGTVVHIYPDNKAYVVEIFGENEVKTVTKDQLILVKKGK